MNTRDIDSIFIWLMLRAAAFISIIAAISFVAERVWW